MVQGRLLHYFPSAGADSQISNGSASASIDWCAWHTDHGSITGGHGGATATLATWNADRAAAAKSESQHVMQMNAAAGLTAAMYLCGDEEVPCPDATAGLHIRARNNEVVKATIRPDELAFQVCILFPQLNGQPTCS